MRHLHVVTFHVPRQCTKLFCQGTKCSKLQSFRRTQHLEERVRNLLGDCGMGMAGRQGWRGSLVASMECSPFTRQFGMGFLNNLSVGFKDV